MEIVPCDWSSNNSMVEHETGAGSGGADGMALTKN